MKWGFVAKRFKAFATNCKPMPVQCNRIMLLSGMNRRKRMRCIRMPGKKSEPQLELADPARRRGNKERGDGNYENDRPPIVGTVGRQSGKVRLRMVAHTDAPTLETHVEHFTTEASQIYTDEWQGYNHVDRPHDTVCHTQREWARDDDGDGIHEVHINTVEGMWTLVRNFIRLFRGVHKKHLPGYLAICEFHINLKRNTPAFIATLVAAHL